MNGEPPPNPFPPPMVVQAPPTAVRLPVGERRRTGRVWMVVAIAALAILAVYIAVGAVIALRSPAKQVAGATAAQTPAASAPGPASTGALRETGDGAPRGVALADNGGSITLSWTDTTAGTVQFAVVGGPRGAVPKLQKVLPPGTTSLTLQGINTGVDYCFVVMAIVDAQTFARAPQVCTSR
jgi:hypothetical protein